VLTSCCEVDECKPLILGTFIVYIALGFAGVTTNWALGICTALAGVWWFVTSWFAFARLPERPAGAIYF
jgi:hypothetical protein